jgi:predicted transcriptional regulator
MVPDGNHGDNLSMSQPNSPERQRIAFDVSPAVSALLDHISDVTGSTKSGMAASALLDALPDLLSRADQVKKRHVELAQGKPRK